MVGKKRTRTALFVGYNAGFVSLSRRPNQANDPWRFWSVPAGWRHLLSGVWKALRADAIIACESPSPIYLLIASRRGIGMYRLWDVEDVAEARTRPHATALFARRNIRHIATSASLIDALRSVGIAATQFPAEGIGAKLDVDRVADNLSKQTGTRAARRVIISGFDYFVAEMLRHDPERTEGWQREAMDLNTRSSRALAVLQLIRSDVYYTVGATRKSKWIELLAFALDKPRVMHWVGNDIEMLGTQPIFRLFWKLRTRKVLHLAEIDWTAQRLEQFGLHPQIVSLPTELSHAPLAPLPDVFTMLLYVPLTRQEHYGAREYERLIAAMKNEAIAFIIVGGGTLRVDADAQVQNLGWQAELDPIYDRSSALVRFTSNDGLSCMVLEALSHGRHVLWRKVLPFICKIETYADLERETRRLLAEHRAGVLRPRDDAAEYARTRFDMNAVLQDVSSAWTSVAPVHRR